MVAFALQCLKILDPSVWKLREDGLVPDDLDAVLSTFPPEVSRAQNFYSLNDTFIIDFSHIRLTFCIITEQVVGRLRFYGLVVEQRGTQTRRPAYTGAYYCKVYKSPSSIDGYNNKFVGSALVRFERSTLPEHKGTRTVVLRFLKIITPVKCVIPFYDSHIVSPEEGELYRRRRAGKPIDLLNPPVWSVNIDKSVTFRSFQLLWDT